MSKWNVAVFVNCHWPALMFGALLVCRRHLDGTSSPTRFILSFTYRKNRPIFHLFCSIYIKEFQNCNHKIVTRLCSSPTRFILLFTLCYDALLQVQNSHLDETSPSACFILSLKLNALQIWCIRVSLFCSSSGSFAFHITVLVIRFTIFSACYEGKQDTISSSSCIMFFNFWQSDEMYHSNDIFLITENDREKFHGDAVGTEPWTFIS